MHRQIRYTVYVRIIVHNIYIFNFIQTFYYIQQLYIWPGNDVHIWVSLIFSPKSDSNISFCIYTNVDKFYIYTNIDKFYIYTIFHTKQFNIIHIVAGRQCHALMLDNAMSVHEHYYLLYLLLSIIPRQAQDYFRWYAH